MRHILTDLRGNPIYSFAHRRLRRMRHSLASTLLLLVQNRSWESVLHRAAQHPQEVWIVDDGGNTPLHVAARLDPPPAVVKALQVTSRVANLEGITPLHIAASHRCSAAALRALIACAGSATTITTDGTVAGCLVDTPSLKESDASSVGEKEKVMLSPTADLSRMGRAPIHYACLSFRGHNIEAFSVLLDATLKSGFVTLHDFVVDEALPDFEEFDEEFTDDFCDTKKLKSQHSEAKQRVKKVINVMNMKDATGQTPLGLLFRRYRERVRCVISTVDRLRREHPNREQAAVGAALAVHADLGELWEKARLIVIKLTEERLQREDSEKAASNRSIIISSNATEMSPPSPGEEAVAQEAAQYAMERHQRVDNTSIEDEDFLTLPGDELVTDRDTRRLKFRIVHASVGLTGYGCPPEMIRLALSIYPNQVHEMDEDGNLPLHIAAAEANYVATTPNGGLPEFHNQLGIGEISDDHSVVSTMSFFSSATISQTVNPFDKVIKMLLQQYPEAAKIPQGRTGRLPLVMALESGLRTWEDGIRTLLNAYPPALHDKKLIEPALYPNVLGLVTNASNLFFPLSRIGGSSTGLDDLLPRGSQHLRSRRARSNTQAKRREECARTTLFELLRTKPEWLVSEA